MPIIRASGRRPSSSSHFHVRTDTADPLEAFGDLDTHAFVAAAGRISRRKVDRLDSGPYQRALLERGIVRRDRWDQNWISADLTVGMEYSGAVGAMVMDEVCDVNERLDAKMEDLAANVGEQLGNVREQVEERVDVIMGDVSDLTREQGRLRADVDHLSGVVRDQGIRYDFLSTVVENLSVQLLALRSRSHPIVVEDSEAGDDEDDDGDDSVEIVITDQSVGEIEERVEDVADILEVEYFLPPVQYTGGDALRLVRDGDLDQAAADLVADVVAADPAPRYSSPDVPAYPPGL
jgi:hypothetical protein